MSGPLILYTNPMSRGQIARWMIEEAGVPYETRLLDYGTTMKGADYLAVNPMGKVPAIVHDGRVVTEVAAICAYLADTFPDAGLAPSDDERADYYRWLFFAAGPIEQAVTNKAMGFEPASDKQMMVGYGSFDLVVRVLDQMLTGRAFACGDRFTAADVYLGSQVSWGLQFGTLPALDSLRAYGERVTARPAYRKAKAIDEALIAESAAAKG